MSTGGHADESAASVAGVGRVARAAVVDSRGAAVPAPSASPSADGPFSPAYRLITVAVVALVTIVAFEFMAISTAMPAAAQELDAVRSYGLAFSVMLTGQLLGIVLAGVWSDRSGPMPGLYAGQLLFAGGAAICGLAPSFAVLLVGRAVTGLGAGLVVVVLYVVIGRVYPSEVRPRVFAWVSAAWVVPSLVGAPLSGWLSTAFSWRLVFWVVVPPTVVTFVVILRQRARLAAGPPGDVAATDPGRRAHRRTAGAGVLVALAAGLVQLGTHERLELLSWPMLATVVGVVGLLLVTPRVLPAGTLRMAAGIPSVVLSRFFLNAAFNGAITFVPLMFTLERGANLSVAGAVLAAGSFGWTFGSWVQGRSAFAGRRAALVSLGGLFLTVGILLMVAVTATGLSVWFFAPAMVLLGLGMGLGSTSLSVLLLDLAPVSDYSAASAALQLADVLGSVLGIAGAGALFASLHTTGGDRHTYIVIWAVLSAVAALVVVTGRRCVPVDLD